MRTAHHRRSTRRDPSPAWLTAALLQHHTDTRRTDDVTSCSAHLRTKPAIPTPNPIRALRNEHKRWSVLFKTLVKILVKNLASLASQLRQAPNPNIRARRRAPNPRAHCAMKEQYWWRHHSWVIQQNFRPRAIIKFLRALIGRKLLLYLAELVN